MITKPTLEHVADLAGIAKCYTDAWGDEAEVPEQTLRQILTIMGYDTSEDARLMASAVSKHQSHLSQPVVVVRGGEQPVDIPLRIGRDVSYEHFSWQIRTEDHQHFEGKVATHLLADRRDHDGTVTLRITGLTLGYHQLWVKDNRTGHLEESLLIIAPAACYKQPALLSGQKMWGLSIQLYTLRSKANWGIGDFGDLKQLVTEVADKGAQFIGLNPLHTLFPDCPEFASPYSPSSRFWLNTLYIDVSSVPEFVLSHAAQSLVGSADFQHRLEQTRAKAWVDYTEVNALKMTVLPLLYQEFRHRHLAHHSERAQAFIQFVEQGGESLTALAVFHVLSETFCQTGAKMQDTTQPRGWAQFPPEYQDYQSETVQTFIETHQEAIHFHMYLQWIADSQLKETQLMAKERGMTIGLYRDLAVGVSKHGCDTWVDSHHQTLVQTVSVGAPPDILGPLGQDWGLPPFHPVTLREQAYRPFIDLLRANMKHCGALRIDHVLGLLRLWWIPEGKTAKEGAYVYYPVEHLLAILALESHRHQCAVIGEDLGTVPAQMAEILASAGIHSYKVFFFEKSQQGVYTPPSDYPYQSMTALCTHDMPTLRGFWHGSDLSLGQQLGLYPDETQLEQLHQDRAQMRHGVLQALGMLNAQEAVCAGASPTDSAEAHRVMDPLLGELIQLHVASGRSALVSIQLEDLLAMDEPVNVPGTVDQYPNWRRKLSTDLTTIFSLPAIRNMLVKLTQMRAA
ncbi:4-alpha-glucanotransferase [Vibrio sp. MEBiC08052]|uniref:4-alpha-glucanotransferase n=1 Tax=Vibrio sp. MEBiC08052 TaxID=1761910 RepID=UPI00074069CD|nr:4-alpha-glucanotransferase [Vibrio sp. MEBiC08052]KUI99238.1 4-alpha-glucanotransferase [Vibrio sp. MEBiC08052]